MVWNRYPFLAKYHAFLVQNNKFLIKIIFFARQSLILDSLKPKKLEINTWFQIKANGRDFNFKS